MSEVNGSEKSNEAIIILLADVERKLASLKKKVAKLTLLAKALQTDCKQVNS